MESETAARPAGWWWGTNRPGGGYYAGRVHVVHPDQPTTGLCGLPVDDVWQLRPPVPEHLCPDCCVAAMAASYPPFPTVPPPRPSANPDVSAEGGWFAPTLDNRSAAAEQTAVLSPTPDESNATPSRTA
jgi:hypothetical protein